jgi:glycosyltransferase involved in cell wall biosynthesis
VISPLVSIVMPCYNIEEFVEYSLMSIEAQTYKNYEIIMVNDGSTDATSELILKFQKHLPIKFIDFRQNVGISGALNAAMAEAQGSFIARFDADDYMLPYRLADQVNYFCENPNVDLLGGGAQLFGVSKGEHRPRSQHSDILNEFLLNNPFIHPTIMFRRKLFDIGLYRYEGGLPNEEDYELWSRILSRVKVGNLSYPLIKYRIHNNNAQRNPGKKQVKTRAISQFLTGFGVNDPVLAHALAEYQCSGHFTYEDYQAVRSYVQMANVKGLPKLAWIHNFVTKENSHKRFMEYS